MPKPSKAQLWEMQTIHSYSITRHPLTFGPGPDDFPTAYLSRRTWDVLVRHGWARLGEPDAKGERTALLTDAGRALAICGARDPEHGPCVREIGPHQYHYTADNFCFEATTEE